MTIEEAIKGLEVRAIRNNRSADICEMKDGHTLQYHDYRDGAKEKYQIAEWLKDYSRLLSEHRTGHWILIDEELSRYKCSECGEVIKLYKKSELSRLEKDETLSDYPFSHCGCCMIEP